MRPGLSGWVVALTLGASSAMALEHQVAGGLILNPDGAVIRYDLSVPVGAGFKLGLYDEFMFYSNGVGGTLGWATKPAWLTVDAEIGAEPGVFLKLSEGQERGDQTQRTFDYRVVARLKTEVNIRTATTWFYSRTTALYRHRGFREDDTFRILALNEERSFEQALALMRRIPPFGSALKAWLYGEYTVGFLSEAGTYPNRPSMGLILENWPLDRATVNLDVFYSLVSAPLDGVGALLFFWYRW